MDGAGSSQDCCVLEKQNKLDDQVTELKKKVQELKQDIQVLLDLLNEHDFGRKPVQNTKVGAYVQLKDVHQKETVNTETCFGLNKARDVVSVGLVGALKLADQIQFALISEEIPELKRRQQISCIGGPANICLDQLQNWFTSVAECLQQVHQQLNILQELAPRFSQDDEPFRDLSSLQEQEHSLFENLLMNCLVVERQPCLVMHPHTPLVLRICVQFTVKVRLLVRLPDLNEQLKVKITFDKDLPENDTVKSFQRFNVLVNTTRIMNVEESNGCFVAEFRHLIMRRLRQPENRINKFSLCIMEQLHYFSLDVQLNLSGRCLDLTTTSLPVVVITAVTPKHLAWAAILWYNMLSTEDQNLAFFVDPPKVGWRQLSEVLNWQFSCTVGRGLSKQQLNVLRDKITGERADDCEVSWSQFCKENMPGTVFRFWQWLDSLLVLIRKFLHPVWADGYVMGFVSEEMVRELLKDKESGTFLLHFCENHLGSITFTWVEQINGEVKFTTAEPYTNYNLNVVPFADIIRDYKVAADGSVSENPLKFLYPGIPRDEAFGKYYSRGTE